MQPVMGGGAGKVYIYEKEWGKETKYQPNAKRFLLLVLVVLQLQVQLLIVILIVIV